MDSLNQLEIQNIRHIDGLCCNICNKIEYYKTLSSDDNTNKLFDKTCTNVTSLKQKLAELL